MNGNGPDFFTELMSWSGTTWSAIDDGIPSAADGVALAYDTLRHETVRLGGGSSEANVTWTWNGSSWTRRTTGNPGRTLGGAMAFDAVRGVALLFGGSVSPSNGGERQETWLWDGAAWTQLFPANMPPRRQGHALVYDANRQVIVMFGGSYVSGNPFPIVLGDTWEWNGTSWSLRSSTGPSPRSQLCMAYDARRQVTVLFGGGNNGINRSDTWEWNGTSWSRRSTTGPAATLGNTMFSDSARERVVLYNGNDIQTWEWDGDAGAWSALGISGPPQRVLSSVAYDEERRTAVLVGGYSNHPGGTGFDYGETWEFSTLQIPGDVDHNGVVELADLATLLAHFGTQSGATFEEGDLDADGDVDVADLAMLLANFGATCP
jgi:hypothetical protein